MQINPEKYSYQPWSLVTSRLRTMWPAYFGYLTLFTVTSSFFALHRFLPWNAYREISEMIPRVFNNFVFQGSEAFGGAMWFVPMLFITVALFAIVLHISFGYFKKHPLAVAGILSGVAGAAGVMINAQKIDLAMHAQTSLLLLPILYLGYLLTSLKVDKHKVFNTLLALPCLIIIWFFVVKPGRRIDLAAEQIGKPYTFYVITISGVYLICVVAKWLCKYPLTQQLFSFLGKYSFDIMAMHFLMFKVVDRVWEYLWPNPEVSVTTFPCVDRARWPVYLLCSLLFPPLFRIVLNRGIAWLNAKLLSHQSERKEDMK